MINYCHNLRLMVRIAKTVLNFLQAEKERQWEPGQKNVERFNLWNCYLLLIFKKCTLYIRWIFYIQCLVILLYETKASFFSSRQSMQQLSILWSVINKDQWMNEWMNEWMNVLFFTKLFILSSFCKMLIRFTDMLLL